MKWFWSGKRAWKHRMVNGGYVIRFDDPSSGSYGGLTSWVVGEPGEFALEFGWTRQEVLARLLPLLDHDCSEVYLSTNAISEQWTRFLEAISEIDESVEACELDGKVDHEFDEATEWQVEHANMTKGVEPC